MTYSSFRWVIFLIVQMWSALTLAAQTGRDTDQQKLDKERLEVEKTRIEGDLRLREEELKLKREELELKKKEQEESGFLKFNAASATIAVALLGLLGTAIGALIQARSNYRTQTDLEKEKSKASLDLEHKKFESDLILKAIETGGGDASTRNLLFLLKAGFIKDPEDKIAALAKDPDAVPVLPPRAFTSGVFEGITPEGSGGDPKINVLKNRDLPPKEYVHMTLEEISALPMPDVPNIGGRNSWPEETRKEIDRIESRGVVVEGYLLRTHVLGPTAANAKRPDPRGRDWALSLFKNPNDEISKSITAVISPRVRSAHADWTFAKLRELSQGSPKSPR